MSLFEKPIKGKGQGSTIIADDLNPPEKPEKQQYLRVYGTEKYTEFARGLGLNPRGVIVAGTDPSRILATAWQLRNLARAASKKGTLTSPFVGLVYLDEITKLADIQRVLRGISKKELPMGICTRRQEILYQADKIFPKEIDRIFLLWAGSKTVQFSDRFNVQYAYSKEISGLSDE